MQKISTLLKRYKKLITVTAALLVILLVILAVYLNRPGSIAISTEDGADIFVTNKRGGEFEKIGNTVANYSTRDLPKTIYIQSVKDDKKTITSIQLDRGDEKTANLSLNETKNASVVFNGSVSDVYNEGSYYHGILPSQYTLINFAAQGEVPPRPAFISLPYMQKVITYDSNNFIYNAFRTGVGRFVNGSNIGNSDLGASVSGTNVQFDTSIDGGLEYIDISKATDQPLVIMSRQNLFVSNDMGTTLQSIADFDIEDGSSFGLFATESYIYRFSGEDPSAYASESNADENTESAGSTSLFQYDYNGNQLAVIPIGSDEVTKVVSNGQKSYILTEERLYEAGSDSLKELDLYFTFARDLISYNGQVVLLGDDGLWQVSEDGNSLQLLFEFKDNGVGLSNSMSLSGNQLIFGTQPRPDDETSNAQTYSISF